MEINLDLLITDFRKIDKKREKALKKLGLITLQDLIFYFPKRYEDFSTITAIKDLRLGSHCTIRGQIKSIDNEITPRRRMRLTKATISDKTGSISAVWFHQLYLKNYLKPETNVTLSGKVERGYPTGWQMISPSYEKYKPESIHSGRIIPIYSESAQLTSRWLRFIIKPLLNKIGKIQEWMPRRILDKHKLIDINQAINAIHFPANINELNQAKKRLAFDEMFLLQLRTASLKLNWQKNKSRAIKFDKLLIKDFVAGLPFKLTNPQKIASWEILNDLANAYPMNRLLQGDVGSGKTVVAAIAILQAISAGHQSALMAPTEILAKQHYLTLKKYFTGRKINIALLSRNNAKTNLKKISVRNDIIRAVNQGKIDLTIGTHALIQEKICFKNLALAIVDEQHRFGVKQREKLKKIDQDKKIAPHLLSMTATPIPRTLSLSIYGDLDVSIIDQLPPGRKKIITKLVSPDNRDRAYQFIRLKILQGQQAFVVCPLIEESDKLGVKSAKAEFNRLKKQIFPDLKIGILHGKQNKEEKDRAMQAFINNDISILVATAVIEVGVDIPNAVIMMIEGADRFGLSQLHQFRGRVGRSENQSYCLLFTDSESKSTNRRLLAMTKIDNGFKLAEIDLRMRGAGEIFGIKQSGLPDLRMASLTDLPLIKSARNEARLSLSADPQLQNYPRLKNKLAQFTDSIHME